MCERVCPWCGSEFETKKQSKVYCSTSCKTTFNNAMTVIGKRIAPVALAWRVNRGGKGVGSAAMKELCALLDQANAEFMQREVAEGVKRRPTISDHFRAIRNAGNAIIRKIDGR